MRSGLRFGSLVREIIWNFDYAYFACCTMFSSIAKYCLKHVGAPITSSDFTIQIYSIGRLQSTDLRFWQIVLFRHVLFVCAFAF